MLIKLRFRTEDIDPMLGARDDRQLDSGNRLDASGDCALELILVVSRRLPPT